MGSKKVVDKIPVSSETLDISALNDFRPGQMTATLLKQGFVLTSVFSPKECYLLLQQCDTVGFTFWNNTKDDAKFRGASTFEVIHKPLADLIWTRIEQVVRAFSINEIDEDGTADLEVVGRWKAYGVNPNLLFCKYDCAKHFAPHTDGSYIIDINHRSFYTILLYLSDVFDGGETILYKDSAGEDSSWEDCEERIRGSPLDYDTMVVPRQGTLLCFEQTALHEGAPVGFDNSKYIIRTDLMYERETPILTEENDEEAYRLWLRGQKEAEEGNVDGAQAAFRKCFKLSPALKDFLKM